MVNEGVKKTKQNKTIKSQEKTSTERNGRCNTKTNTRKRKRKEQKKKRAKKKKTRCD